MRCRTLVLIGSSSSPVVLQTLANCDQKPILYHSLTVLPCASLPGRRMACKVVGLRAPVFSVLCSSDFYGRQREVSPPFFLFSDVATNGFASLRRGDKARPLPSSTLLHHLIPL
ncbi:hypothetical protein CGRA01v4_02493 [Colletotrichum graminicola]|nr:hypothetical protein CGRA01v4_02493 [Colletotrichum graminicola]